MEGCPKLEDPVAELDSASRAALVRMLRLAAKLEHCLLNTYLIAATSIKSRPEEFATLPPLRSTATTLAADDVRAVPAASDASAAHGEEIGDNRRRAVQFEMARSWKQRVLEVAVEEMLHLHYVNCLLRSLGEAPEFGLPPRDKDGWVINDWYPDPAEVDAGDSARDKPALSKFNVTVGLQTFSIGALKKFVAYESTDALQTEDPFSSDIVEKFERMREWELKFRIAQSLFFQSESAPATEDIEKLHSKLFSIYDSLMPIIKPAMPMGTKSVSEQLESAAAAATTLYEPFPTTHFRSIADLYQQGIAPLFEEAFERNWITCDNRDLNNELQGPSAAEGFLSFIAVGPVFRGDRFKSMFQSNVSRSLDNFKQAKDIIDEIVTEGEGFNLFTERLQKDVLDKDPIEYLHGLQTKAKASESLCPVKPLSAFEGNPGELLRQSHLYKFAVSLAEVQKETKLCADCDLAFSPTHDEVLPQTHPVLKNLASSIAPNFNAMYLCLCAWLSRIYERQVWLGDQSRRLAIEMIATWPLMSLGVRPFLELASFFTSTVTNDLFEITEKGLPMIPLHARQLLRLFNNPERSEAINSRMDSLICHVLEDVAGWAETQHVALSALDAAYFNTDVAKEIILARLQGLMALSEFRAQFPFRMAGGYSNTQPTDMGYAQTNGADSDKFEENPGRPTASGNAGPADGNADPADKPLLFENTFLLRLQFEGWARVHQATDPEPPSEESGCTGTQMLHSTDAGHVLDRAIYFQQTPGNDAIVRGPASQIGKINGVPDLGVNCVAATLQMCTRANAQYNVVGNIAAQVGAVQTSGIQLDLGVEGLVELVSVPVEQVTGDPSQKIRIDLEPVNGRTPFLNGNNHLVWKDGEPVDPFVLAVSVDGAEGKLRRSVYNEGLSMMQFNPLQRIGSSRFPVGFGDAKKVPDWAAEGMPEPLKSLVTEHPEAYPMSYLMARANTLVKELIVLIPADEDLISLSQKAVDEIVTYVERSRRVSIPRDTTRDWLQATLHYGHTVSGKLDVPDSFPVIKTLTDTTGLPLVIRPGPRACHLSDGRTLPNSRWLTLYTFGAMDTDALAMFVYGDIFVPLELKDDPSTPVTLSHVWKFSAGMLDIVALYTCAFCSAFWANFAYSEESGQAIRRISIPNPITPNGAKIDIVEKLVQGSPGKAKSGKKPVVYKYEYSSDGIPGVTGYRGQLASVTAPQTSGDAQAHDAGPVPDDGVVFEWSISFKASSEAKLTVAAIFANTVVAMDKALQAKFAPVSSARRLQ